MFREPIDELPREHAHLVDHEHVVVLYPVPVQLGEVSEPVHVTRNADPGCCVHGASVDVFRGQPRRRGDAHNLPPRLEPSAHLAQEHGLPRPADAGDEHVLALLDRVQRVVLLLAERDGLFRGDMGSRQGADEVFDFRGAGADDRRAGHVKKRAGRGEGEYPGAIARGRRARDAAGARAKVCQDCVLLARARQRQLALLLQT